MSGSCEPTCWLYHDAQFNKELLHPGADVLFNLLLQACCSIHLVPPDPSNLPRRFSWCYILADCPFWIDCGLSLYLLIPCGKNSFWVWIAGKRFYKPFTFVPGPLGFHKTSSHSSPLFSGASFDSGAEESAFKGFSSSPGFFKPVSGLPPGY